ncbi:MAG: universal stress protein [Burkholderiaceae bacterium]
MDTLSSRLLVVLEDSELADSTAALGVALAARLTVPVTFVSCVEPLHIEGGSPELLLATDSRSEEEERAQVAPIFERALQRAAQANVAADTALTLDKEPAAAIRELVAQRQCAMIVVGSHGHGTLMRAITGSLVKDLIRTSPVPVLVCRADMFVDAPSGTLRAPGPAGPA